MKETIKKEAYISDSNKKPVTDGPIDEVRFRKTTNRVLFVTLEPYGDQGGWDLPESLNAKSSLKEQSKHGLRTIQKEVEIVNVLQGETIDVKSEIAYDNYKGKAAVVNIKKEPNSCSKANPNELKRHAKENKELIKRQIKEMELTSGKSDAILLAGSGRYLVEKKDGGVEILDRFYPNENIKEYTCGKNTYIKYDNKDGEPPIVACPHPSARFGYEPQAEDIKHILNDDVINEGVNSSNKNTSDLNSIGGVIKTAYANTKKWVKANPKTTVAVVAGIAIVITVATLYARKKKRKEQETK